MVSPMPAGPKRSFPRGVEAKRCEMVTAYHGQGSRRQGSRTGAPRGPEAPDRHRRSADPAQGLADVIRAYRRWG
jgi:hypothetical protein